jgi:hypothetical protein
MAIKKTAKRKNGKMQKGGRQNNVQAIIDAFRSDRAKTAQAAAAIGDNFYPHATITKKQARDFLNKTGKIKQSPYFSSINPKAQNINYEAIIRNPIPNLTITQAPVTKFTTRMPRQRRGR